MTQQFLGLGTVGIPGSGDPAPLFGAKCNANFSDLYAQINQLGFSVLQFGADPTGGADSTAAFQATVNASNYVFVPVGTYKIAGQVVMSGNVWLVGASRNGSVINTSSSVDSFAIAGGQGGGIMNLTFGVGNTGGYVISNGNSHASGPNGGTSVGNGAGRTLLSNLTFRNNAAGCLGCVYAQDFNQFTLQNIYITGTYAPASLTPTPTGGGAAIYLFGSSNAIANVAHLINVTYGGAGAAVSASWGLVMDSGVQSIRLYGFINNNCFGGFITANSVGVANFAQFITGFLVACDTIYSDGFIFGTAAGVGTCTTHRINGLYCHLAGSNNVSGTLPTTGAGGGNGIYSFSNCYDVTIQGGIVLTAAMNAIYNNGRQHNVADLRCVLGSQFSIGTQPGIELGATAFENNIHDCIIGQMTGYGLSDFSYGVQLDAGSLRNNVHDNLLLLNSTNAILNNSGDPATYIHDNYPVTGSNLTTRTNVLMKSGIPFIVAPTGTMANNGAITLGTALLTTYANAYIYLPAGAIAAGSLAGWYFCQMSSTTAGTVFNNTYGSASGQPSIPGSPTAFVTTGPGAYTGVTSEVNGPSISIPGGSLGINGQLRFNGTFQVPNNANAKTVQLNVGGTNYTGNSLASVAFGSLANKTLTNRGVLNSQITDAGNGFGSGTGAGNPQYFTLNFGTALTWNLGVTMATATDYIVMESYELEATQ